MSRKRKKIIVNLLSLSRVIGALVLPFFIDKMSIPWLIAVITCLFLTDFLDGKLARRWKVATRGGALLDPLGDKILAITCLLSFMKGKYILLVPLGMEVAIMFLNIYRTLHGEEVQTLMIGKIKTFILSANLVLCAINVLNFNIFNIVLSQFGFVHADLAITDDIVKVVAKTTIIAEILAFGGYIIDGFKNSDKRTKKIAKLKSFKEMLNRLFDEESYLVDREKPLLEILRNEG